MTTDERIDRFLAAMEAAGARPVPSGREGDSELAALDRALAPLRLPADLHRFYERIAPAALPIRPYPPLSDLDFAHWSWREQVDDPNGSQWPACLFPMAYESWNHLLIELNSTAVDSSPIFEGAFGDDRFALRLASFGDWLDVTAQALDEGLFDTWSGKDSVVLRLDVEEWRALALRQLEAASPHPVYGDRVEVGMDPEEWPEHWHATGDLVRDRPPLEKAECTIADLLAVRGDGQASVTLDGRYEVIPTQAGRATHLVLWDHTGKIHIEVPPKTPGAPALDLAGQARVVVVAETEQFADPRTDLWAGLELREVAERTHPQAVAQAVEAR